MGAYSTMGDDWDDDEWEAPDLSASKEAPESWSDEEGHDAHKEETPGMPTSEAHHFVGLFPLCACFGLSLLSLWLATRLRACGAARLSHGRADPRCAAACDSTAFPHSNIFSRPLAVQPR